MQKFYVAKLLAIYNKGMRRIELPLIVENDILQTSKTC